MALFAKSLEQIKLMLAQMTFSQKMLMVSLGVIIVGCVAWLMSYAGRPDMVPVFDQAFEPAVHDRLVTALKSSGIDAEVRDGKVTVPSGRQGQARAALATNHALPADFSYGFEQVVNDSNIWRSESEKERMWKVALENELAAGIRWFDGVADAKVIVDRPQRAAFGHAGGSTGSAAVHLRMRPGAVIDRKLIMAVADWVSGAIRDLPRERVKLVDATNGRSYRVPSEDAAIPADLLELTKQHEEHLTAGIMRVIGHIPNVLVSVSVRVDPSSRTEKAVSHDRDRSVSLPTDETSSKTSSADGATGGAEPGVRPNTGAVVAASPGGGGSTRSQSEESTSFENRFGTTETVTAEPAGAIKAVTAAVNVPRSYVLAAMKAETGDDSPDPAALKTFADAELARIKTRVMAAIGLDSAEPEKVAVDLYHDAVAASEPAEHQVESAGAIGAVAVHARPIALGALVVVGLLMMLMMVRKAASSGGVIAPPETISAGASGPGGTAINMSAGDLIVGEAGVADGYLQGMEVDEDTLRTQKMVEQVATMVKENPDGAANLVRRWISKKKK